MVVKFKSLKAVFSIAATFIGTVVGAGFASGQEIYQFFTVYGVLGFPGLILATMILGWASNKVFQIGLRLSTPSYREILLYLLGPRFLPAADFFFLLFLLLLTAVMFAGSGMVFKELNLEYGLGIGLTLVILVGVLYRGLPGLVKVNELVIPLMFTVCLIVTGYAIITRCPVGQQPETHGNWILGALQFSAYNLILAVPVLLALARDYPDRALLQMGSWLGSLALGGLAFLIHAAIIVHHQQLLNRALPMVVLAKMMNHWFYWGYALILWGEMLTTLLANVYGLGQRLAVWSGWPLRRWVWLIGIAGIIVARLGFVKLIAGFYPIYGFLSLVLLLLLIVKE